MFYSAKMKQIILLLAKFCYLLTFILLGLWRCFGLWPSPTHQVLDYFSLSAAMIFGSWVYPYLPKLLIVRFLQELIFCLVDIYSRSQFPVICELLSVICIAIMTLRSCLIALFYWILHIWCSTPCNEGDTGKRRGWRSVPLSCLRAR